MAVQGGLPTQFGSKLNMWAMLRALVFNDVGILVFAGTPVNGTSGTYAGKAGKGTLLIDIDTGNLYTNLETKDSPIWQGINSSIGVLGGLGSVGNAKMTYDFAVDGGAQGLITPTNSPTLPNHSIILGGTIDITTTLTSGGAATIALGTSAGSSATSLKGATAVASWGAGQLALVPLFTAATYVKLTAAGRLTLTIGAADLTAGKFDVNLVYLVGN